MDSASRGARRLRPGGRALAKLRTIADEMSAIEDTYVVPAAVAPTRPNERLKGILFLCAGAFIFTFQDIIIKLVSGRYPLSEVLAIRCVVAVPLLLVLVHFDGGLGGLLTRRWSLLLLRAVLLLVCYSCYYLAIAAIPLAEAVPLYYTAPLFIVLLSGPVLGERVGLGRWIAVVVGFAGVVIADSRGASSAIVLAVGSAAFYGLAQVMARRLGVTERASVMTFFHNLVFLAAATVMALLTGDGSYDDGGNASLQFLLRPWTTPTLFDFAIIAATGFIAALGSFCLTHAYRIAEANVVAPFEFTSIIWAVIGGLVVWGYVPDAAMITGALLIVAAGVYVLTSSRQPR